MKKSEMTIFGRFKSIRDAMMLSFSVLVVVAVLIFLLIAMNFTKKTIYENSRTSTSQLISQVNYDIDSYIDYMENISWVAASGSDLSRYLFNQEQTPEEKEAAKERILTQFTTILESRSDIYNVAAVADNGEALINSGADRLNKYVDVRQQSWYQAAIHSPTGIAVSSSHVQNAIAGSYHWVITLSRAIVNEQTGEREGVFFVDLNYSAISSLCSNTSIGSKGYIFILDEKGSMIYHPQQQLIYGGLKEERIEDILASKGDFLETEEGEDSKLYTMSKSEKTGWTVVGASYVTELMKNNRQAQMLYLLAAAGILIGVILISSFISSEITKPLRRLRDSMSLVEKGDFEQASVEITAENEIGSLSKSFNAMTQKIHALMEQNIYEQKQKRKSEMKALQAQINPHFLYNTLDSIIWMSEAGENDQVVLMTSALAKLLRQSISNDREQITVAEEIDYVRSYLTIQKMRYKDKLEYTIDVEERILDVRIIKFVLQPLVENAIYHGLKYKETKGNLDIRGYRRGNRVCLVVADDGAGMEESELEHILEKKEKKTKSNGVGVYNVQKRLQLYYGPEYGISYISRKGEGTVATVTIPLDGGKSNEETGR